MKNDFIKIYEKAFAKAEISAEKKIIEKYVEFKKNGRSTQKAERIIIQEFYDKKSNSELLKEPFLPLYGIFKNRLEEFSEEHQMNIIPEILFPEFSQIDKPKDFTFEKYITELAKLNARDKIYNIFSNNKSLYSLMFKLNDFSEFSIRGLDGGYHSEIYEKYRQKLYVKSINDSKNEEKSFDFEKEKLKLQEKVIKEKFYDKLISLEFYNHLCNSFINKEKTSYEDYLDVFLNSKENRKGQIHFFCSSQLAAGLMFELKQKVFNFSSFSDLLGESFFTHNEIILKSNNASKAKSNLLEEDEEVINKVFSYLEKIEVKKS